MFAIADAFAFFTHAKQNLAALEEDIANSSRAMNCILSAYHLHEWVWAHSLKRVAPVQGF